jgi:hypothetical protein
MPILETILAGAAGGIGGSAASESVKPMFKDLQDYHRYMMLFAIVFLLLLWFLILPSNTKRKLKV